MHFRACSVVSSAFSAQFHWFPGQQQNFDRLKNSNLDELVSLNCYSTGLRLLASFPHTAWPVPEVLSLACQNTCQWLPWLLASSTEGSCCCIVLPQLPQSGAADALFHSLSHWQYLSRSTPSRATSLHVGNDLSAVPSVPVVAAARSSEVRTSLLLAVLNTRVQSQSMVSYAASSIIARPPRPRSAQSPYPSIGTSSPFGYGSGSGAGSGGVGAHDLTCPGMRSPSNLSSFLDCCVQLACHPCLPGPASLLSV